MKCTTLNEKVKRYGIRVKRASMILLFGLFLCRSFVSSVRAVDDPARTARVISDQGSLADIYRTGKVRFVPEMVIDGRSLVEGVLFVSLLPAQIRVPNGKNILPNGQFAPGEWKDSAEVKSADTVALYFKHDSAYLYLGIKFLAEMHTGIDLYLAEPGGRRKKLHVSAALGEAEWKDGSWTDIQWGKNALWTANSIGLISDQDERKVVPLEGFEFQISRDLLPGSRWLLFFHLKRPELKFPVEGNPDDTAQWMEIDIPGKR